MAQITQSDVVFWPTTARNGTYFQTKRRPLWCAEVYAGQKSYITMKSYKRNVKTFSQVFSFLSLSLTMRLSIGLCIELLFFLIAAHNLYLQRKLSTVRFDSLVQNSASTIRSAYFLRVNFSPLQHSIQKAAPNSVETMLEHLSFACNFHHGTRTDTHKSIVQQNELAEGTIFTTRRKKH